MEKTYLRVAGIFAFIIIALTIVSAASLSIDSTKATIPQDVSHNAGSFKILFELANAGEVSDIQWGSSTVNQGATFSFDKAHINAGTPSALTIEIITATINFPAHKSGKIEGKIIADPSTGNNVELPFSVQILESKSLTIETITPLTKTQNGSLKIKNTGNIDLKDIKLDSKEDADFTISFEDELFDLKAGESKTIKISSTDIGSLELGDDNVLTITATSDNIKTEEPITVDLSYCEFDIKGNLKIKNIDIDNLDGNNKEWEPLNEIEIKVEIENKGEEDINDVILEILIMRGDEDVTDDFNLEDDKIDLGDIDKDDEEIGTFRIPELPADLKDSNYKIYFKAYSEDNEDVHCIDNKDKFSEIKIKRNKDAAVIIKNYEFTKDAKAGENIELKLNVYNIGENEEENILIILENSELKINERQHIRSFDSGENKELTFTIKIPEDAEAKEYNLRTLIFFDYDKGDIVETASYNKNSFDDLSLTYITRLKISEELKEPAISAILDSTAELGKELVIKVSITNNSPEATYIITAENYDSWANLKSIEPSITTIKKGETKQVVITLTPTKEGTQTFKIKAIYNGQIIEQNVQVDIAGKTGTLTGAFLGLGNTGLYIIAVVFLVLIIIIIVLIIRVSSSTKAEEF